MNLTYKETLELISFLERTFTIRKYGAHFYRKRIEFLKFLYNRCRGSGGSA